MLPELVNTHPELVNAHDRALTLGSHAPQSDYPQIAHNSEYPPPSFKFMQFITLLCTRVHAHTPLYARL